MERWFLTAHLKANVATSTKAMLGIGVHHPAIPCKESTVSRIEKDEICTENIIDVVEKRMVKPFIVESEWDSENPDHWLILQLVLSHHLKFAHG